MPDRDRSAAPSLRPSGLKGTVLGDQYEIVGELGRGAMGIVLEAVDLRLRRPVAVKMATDARYGATLQDEAVALAAVSHPSLVSIYSAGSHDGAPYIVLERLRGISLEERVFERRRNGESFAVSEIAELGIEIACALNALHEAGLAHRDVKPANIMLCPPRRVVVTDLGLARPEYANAAGQRIVGTPAYMAPEVASADTSIGEGPRIDLYSLGVTLFELATMRLPYAGKNIAATLAMHVTAPVPSLADERDDLPGGLVSLIESLMAKDPHDRPMSGAAVVRALREVVAHAEIAPPRILIVDDDAELTRLLETVLRSTLPRAIVDVAHDAEQALRSVRRGGPAVLVLDLALPGVNGLELLALLRQKGALAATTTVVISGRAGDAERDMLAQLGVSRVLAKDEGLVKNLRQAVRETFARRSPA
jgi:serine/threonine-protein kinase